MPDTDPGPLGLRNAPIVPRVLVAAALVAAGGFLAWWRTQSPPRLAASEVALVATDDGMVHIGIFFNDTDTQLHPARTIELMGDVNEGWSTERLTLSPDARWFVVRQLEYADSSTDDIRLTLYDRVKGVPLWNASDNMAYPKTDWKGTDPDAPAALKAQQAASDAIWEEIKQEEPDAPRPIATARFRDGESATEFEVDGWTPSGQLRLKGRSPLELDNGLGGSDLSDLEPWWLVVGLKGKQWSVLASGADTIPDAFPKVLPSLPSRKIEIRTSAKPPGAAVFVNNIEQTALKLTARPILVAGVRRVG